jgi:hypothetical protein
MTQDEIEHMWKVASNDSNHDTNWHDPVVITFAKLVAAKEREACEKICADLMGFPVLIGDCHICVGAIRTRGEQA